MNSVKFLFEMQTRDLHRLKQNQILPLDLDRPEYTDSWEWCPDWSLILCDIQPCE